MRLLAVSSGAYPRIGMNSGGHALRRIWHEFDKGHCAWDDVRRSENEVAREIIYQQEAMGLDIVTDGLVRRYCPISHMAGQLEGVERGALHHFLDTNFHVRKALVRALPRRIHSLIGDEFRFAASCAARPVKAVLTGPATLWYYSENATTFPWERIAEAYVQALTEEVQDLLSAGARYIHFDDPCLLWEIPRWSWYREAYKVLKKACGTAILEIKTYPGPVGDDCLKQLLEFPADCLGVDCTTGGDVLSHLHQRKDMLQKKILALGVVNARKQLSEKPETLARLLEPLITAPGCGLWIEPSCHLEFLPRRYAREKLRIVNDVMRILYGGVA